MGASPKSNGEDIMSEAIYQIDPESLYLDPKQAASIGKSFAERYQSAEPFNYIGIDDFLPLAIAQKVREEALEQGEKKPENMSPQEHLKTSYNPDGLIFSGFFSPCSSASS